MTVKDRLSFIEKTNSKISLTRQAELLEISRSTIYYQPAINDREVLIMNLIDQIYTDCPFYGKRRMAFTLKDDYGLTVGSAHVKTLMKKMGLEAIYPKKKSNLSQPNKQHQVCPYLLRGREIVKPNQVFSADIAYIKLVVGFCYLIAVIDWFSRYVLSWRLSNSLDTDFCLDALNDAYQINRPDIFNSDQGSQFTSQDFIDLSLQNQVAISMDGRGRCLDNIFIERLWRTVKRENVYLSDYQTITEARTGLKDCFNFSNHRRPRQSLNYQTPAKIYFQ